MSLHLSVFVSVSVSVCGNSTGPSRETIPPQWGRRDDDPSVPSTPCPLARSFASLRFISFLGAFAERGRDGERRVAVESAGYPGLRVCPLSLPLGPFDHAGMSVLSGPVLSCLSRVPILFLCLSLCPVFFFLLSLSFLIFYSSSYFPSLSFPLVPASP